MVCFISRREKRSVGPGLALSPQPSDPVPIITEQEAASVVNMTGDDTHLSDDDLLKEDTNSDNEDVS